MRYREKVGYIALGGLLMLVGMLATNLTPVGARLDNFGIITCEELRVVDDLTAQHRVFFVSAKEVLQYRLKKLQNASNPGRLDQRRRDLMSM